MPVLDWIRRRRERVKSLDARKHNTEEENKLLDLAMERWEIARSEKKDHRGRNLNDKWRELDKFYRGDQWKGAVPSYKSKPVLNFAFSLVESVVPRLTDNRPEVLVMARLPDDDKLAEMLHQVQQFLWQFNDMQAKCEEAARLALKYGTAIFKQYWDPDALDGIGCVVYEVVHPMNFFPDPRAYTIPQMEYCFVSVRRSIEYFMQRWPDKGHLVVADQDWADTESIQGADQSSQEESASLKEYWFRDENGNLCVMYYAGHVVLQVIGGKYDGSNEPVYRHNRFPFARLVDYPADKEFWGIGELEIILTLQRLINNFEAQIIDNTRLMANAQWLVNKIQSGLKEEDAWIFENRPGNVIWTAQGGVERLQGVPIPPHVPEHMERLIFAMEQILGVHDVVQGRRPVGVRSASAIIALQESANVRVRQKAAQLEYALKEVADQGNWLVLENMDKPLQRRIGGKLELVTLDVRRALDESMLRYAATERLPLEAMGGAPVEENVPPEYLPPGAMEEIYKEVKFPEFDVEVKVGPSVPYSQALLYEQAKEFYQLGIIDRKAVLDVTNFPNKEEILARIEGQAQQIQGGERTGERTFGGAPF